jgi:hypothetical protein
VRRERWVGLVPDGDGAKAGRAVKKPKGRAAQRGQARVRRAGARGKDGGRWVGGVW